MIKEELMGMLGKIIGGTIGFAMAGPLGAIAGAALGHAFDSNAQTYYIGEQSRLSSGEEAQFTFLFSLQHFQCLQNSPKQTVMYPGKKLTPLKNS